MKHARIQAQITGQAREVGPAEAHERNVLAITRRIHTKQRKLREALAAVKRLRQELRHDKRELRGVLQRSPVVTEEQLETAGKADGVDRSVALAEARKPTRVELTDEERQAQVDEVLGGAK